ncbi:hypothetical protein L6164_032744 [Bauhinia variegata]|uniref:Uncharacterized protein n=1 Tax=Bauhinia variegata TaxID=167791 RepID=A0ACB9KPK0_BAUVA|nr:hypothetical protein L6164_032744 [Bauhinia variegata]
MEEEEALPDHLRCSRNDGRQWRCRRRVMDDLKLCEIHYLQGRHRQYKEKVPESLKLQRKPKKGFNFRNVENGPVLSNVEIRARKVRKMARLMKKRRKPSDGSEALDGPVRKKPLKPGRGDMQLELIRMVLKREVEKRRKKQGEKRKNKNKKKEIEMELEMEEELHHTEEELTRELPNGLMAISPALTPHDYSNVGSPCDVKVGVDYKTITPRYFRSKNVERLPVGKLQVVPDGRNLKKARRKKCHWCQRSDSWNLIKCSSCQKEFFCMDCIKERYFDTQNEVKMACPVCRGTCTCKDCLASRSKDSESKELLAGKTRVDRILHFHYLICVLLPLLKQLNEEQNAELEIEAKIKGERPSDVHIEQVEFGCNEQYQCNRCKTPIFDLHRSCPSCSYRLCLSCCRELSQGCTSGEFNSSKSKFHGKMKASIASEKHFFNKKAACKGKSIATSSLPKLNRCNGTGSVSCPPKEVGGCGDSLLNLRCLFPVNWTKEMEISAEEIVCSYDFPETLDRSSCCSLCLDPDHKLDGFKQLQEAAMREDSNDNYLFYPTRSDINSDHFEHFQKHWGKGHPVVVRDVLPSTSNLSWDPLVMFCAYLERSITRYENNKELLEACLDWCEVEINIRQYFSGSLKGWQPKNMWHEVLKLKGWLSSQLFKEQFPIHFSEVIDALPLQEYMNPTSGLLNLAANLPQGSAKHELGPHVYISYGCAEKQDDSVTKLCYDSYDVVNIMVHTADVPLSTEHLSKIRKLLKKHKSLCEKESSDITSEQLKEKIAKGNSLLHAEDVDQAEVQSVVREETQFLRRVNRTACISSEAKQVVSQSIASNVSQNGECGSDSDSDTDSDPSLFLRATIQTTGMSRNRNYRNTIEILNNERNKKLAGDSCAQWDVFRRQDVPKLIEYLKKHSDEFSRAQDYHKQMVHPILDQRFFLDNFHKMQLKEEFEIEPWTFEQDVGEAVIIPAGCPYQIRHPKCCVSVALEFLSPENVPECIQLTDEVRLLPDDHDAKVDKLEVKKTALYSMSTAIKEIRDLTSKT